MSDAAQGPSGQPESAGTPAATSYFEQLHVALVVALVVICIALGIVGWQLHPDSNGFQAVPQDLRVLVAASGFDAIETIHQTGDDGATLIVTQQGGRGFVPLKDTDSYSVVGGPQGAGAEAVGVGSPVKFNGSTLSSTRWSYIVLHPGTARPCNPGLHYMAGKVTLPLQSPTRALVVPPLRPVATTGGTVLPPGLCLTFASGAPFSLSGPYLSAVVPAASRRRGRCPVDRDSPDG